MSDYETWQANRELDQHHAATDGADAEREAAFARIAALEAERDAARAEAGRLRKCLEFMQDWLGDCIPGTDPDEPYGFRNVLEDALAALAGSAEQQP